MLRALKCPSIDTVTAAWCSGDNGHVNRLAAAPLVLLSCLLFVIGVATPASAHTQLIGVDPGEGSAVSGDSAVTLTFSGDLLAIGAEATVTDSAGAATTLEVTFPTPSSARVMLPAMAGGDLALAWRVVAGDGHPVEGTLSYVGDAPAQTPVSSIPSPAASAAVTNEPTASATPSAATSAANDGSSGSTNIALVIAIFAAVLASSVAIIAANRRR